MPPARSSRRNAPAPQPAAGSSASNPTQPNRTSHDASDSEQPPTRRGLRGSSADSVGTRGGRGGRVGRQGTRAKALQDIPTVAEESQNDGAQAKDRHISRISGTTARTSHSAQDLAELNSEEMIEELPDISHISDITLDLLAPRQASEKTIDKLSRDLQDQNTRVSKNFQKFGAELNTRRGKYGSGPWVDVSIALMGVLKVRSTSEVSGGVWRPDDIFYKANLATAVEDLHARLASDPVELPLEKLDREFPEPFLARIVVSTPKPVYGTSSLSKETFDLALNIRTQFVLQVLNRLFDKPNFDADKLLQQIFYDQDEVMKVRGWEVDGMRAGNLKSRDNKAIVKRIYELGAFFSKTDNSIDFEGLNEAFPLKSFVLSFIKWIRLRVNEIDTSLSAVGNATGLQEKLEAELTRRSTLAAGGNPIDDSVQLNYQPPGTFASDTSAALDPSLAPAGPSAYANPGSIKMLKNLKRNASGNAASRNSIQAPTAHMSTQGYLAYSGVLDPQLAGLGPSGIATRTDLQIASSALDLANDPSTLRSIAVRNMQETRDANKENDPRASVMAGTFQLQQQRSLFDAQPTAQRIAFESQPGPIHYANGAVEDPNEEASEDEGFEQGRIPTTNRRKRAAPGSSGSPAKRSRLVDNSAGPSSVPQEFTGTASTYPEEMDHKAAEYLAANRQAKVNTARIKQNKPVQKRKAWSIEETAHLQNLIETMGISWSAIKKYDDTLTPKIFVTRDQVALKDKARNMAFDLYKAQVELPDNFDLIPLKTSQIEELKQHNVDVVQAKRNAAEATASQGR